MPAAAASASPAPDAASRIVPPQTPLPDPLLTALSQLLGIFGNLKSEDALAVGIPH